jgi:hypothetical protein
MRPIRFLPLVLLLVATIARADSGGWDRWEDFYRDFTAWPLDTTQVARVTSLLIERDACTIVLEEGRLALARPLGGRRVAAVFSGRGTIQFTPHSEIERQQLRRFYSTPTLRRPFRRLTMVFADTTLAELQSALRFAPDTLGSLSRVWGESFAYFTWKRIHAVRPMCVARMLVEREDDGLFWALAADAKNEDPLFFTLDPSMTERVSLARRPEDDRWGMRRLYNAEDVCRFFATGDPDTLRRDENPRVDASAVRLDIDLASDLQMKATAEVDVVSHGRSRNWLHLFLPWRLTVDSVTAAGRTCHVFQQPENSLVWVHLDPPLPAGQAVTVRVAYHGRCFERVEADRVVLVRDWYPDIGAEMHATWDVTVRHPVDMQIVGAGERVRAEPDGVRVLETWRTATPVPWVSFDAGYLRGIRVTGDSLPPLTVWSEHRDGSGRVREARFDRLRDMKGQDERVAYDVARIMGFYTRAWGPAPAPSYNAVETPSPVFIAYPGLIRMMADGDQPLPGAQWTPDFIRAHEIAHQWWGLGVEPATYHDLWLAEGFCNFSAIWYLQAGRRDAGAYFKILGEWRDELLENRHFLLGDGQQAGPVWLGPRTNSSRTPGDYGLVVYRKGAWVLHMLRNVLLRDDDPGESRFRDLLQDFYVRFAGKPAFTEDFRAAVERATGEDMGWFFAQWVYGTDVPTYRFTWRSDAVAEGGWRVHGRIEQSNVPESFRMPVLLRVQQADGAFTRHRVWVTGAVTEFDLPPTPGKVRGVTFNDLESVLCEVVK